MKNRFILIGWLSLLLTAPCVWAQDEAAAEPEAEAEAQTEDGAAVKQPVIYIPIKPPFVVNYGGIGRLRYMKVEVSLRVTDAAGANDVRHHLPYIRNNLILLFSAQAEDQLDTQEGKELLRQAALAEITKVLEAEVGTSKVEDLYFNQLVVQK